jgi:hypothetical protein
MAQVGTLKGEAAKLVLEVLAKARQQAERSKNWAFPVGSPNTLSGPKSPEE